MAVTQQAFSRVNDQSSDYIPVRMLEIELGQPLPTIQASDEEKRKHYRRVRCLVRLHTQPLGLVDLALNKDELAPEEYVAEIWQTLHVQINEHLRQDGLPQVSELTANGLNDDDVPQCIEERKRFLADAPFVSVIVPTHERPEQLAACLNSLMSLRYPDYEVIVVDNAPSTSTTADLVQKFSRDTPFIHYVREDRTGPSWARNCGIKVAKGKILAFADDDVVVDPYWLVELVRGFGTAEDVACVTGLVLPLELETPAQFLFEDLIGFTRGFIRGIFDLKENRQRLPLHPYIAWRFGTGASMAFTSDFIQRVGGFDPTLGSAGPVRCSQDIAVFFQVLTYGHKLVYEPTSLVYHLHRRDYEHLRKQIYHYGVGFTAYLTKSLLDNPHLVFDFIKKLPYALYFVLSHRYSKNSNKLKHYSKEIIALQRKGWLYGPFAYLLSRRQLSRFHRGVITTEDSSISSTANSLTSPNQ